MRSVRPTIWTALLIAFIALVSAPRAVFAAPEADESTTRTPSDPSYEIQLLGDGQGRHWTGNEQITFRNDSSMTLDTIWLRLWSNGVGGCRSPVIVVTGISGGAAGPLAVACTALPVHLDAPLVPGSTAAIAMHVAISVPPSNDRFGYFRGLALLGTALPTLAIHDERGWHLDPFVDLGESFYSVTGHYRVALTVPSTLATPTTGTLVETRNEADGTETRTYEADQVRDFEWAAGNLQVVAAQDASGTAVRVWYAPQTYSAAIANRALGFALTSMNEFASDFGAFPYPEMDVVLSPLAYDGMEYPTIVFSPPARLDISHEIAHQWWSGIVGDDSFSSPWLDESFATWSEALPFGGYGCSRPYRWPSRQARLTNSMAYWRNHPGQYWIVYDQGKCALGAMARQLGQQRFIQLLHDYVEVHRFGFSTTSDFTAAVERAAATWAPDWDVAAFWREWRLDATS